MYPRGSTYSAGVELGPKTIPYMVFQPILVLHLDLLGIPGGFNRATRQRSGAQGVRATSIPGAHAPRTKP